MRTLASLIGLGWFWLLFYGVGPLNSVDQFAVGAATLVVGCLLSSCVGVLLAARRPPSERPGQG